jgi:cytosine/adenosine deaminase-related metal-dependent hydrolase
MKQRSKRKPGAAPSRATEARTWIKEPLAIFAAGADRGVVVEVELVASGQQPATAVDAVCDATRHVVLPGLVNGHHHLYRTLARAHPQAINKELFPWLTASWSFLKRSWLVAAADTACAWHSFTADECDRLGRHQIGIFRFL